MAWTDGACRFNQDPRIRRAGWGVFWGPGDPENTGQPLAGLQQTNQRAELRAATRAVNRGAEEVRTDSLYVVDGHARLGRGERTAARDGSDNADLWVQFEEAVRRRGGPSSVLFTKALGHAKARDVLEGRTTQEDETGNDAADRLAVDAALSHAAPEAVVADLKQRLERAREV